jgi:hypothetical protein
MTTTLETKIRVGYYPSGDKGGYSMNQEPPEGFVVVAEMSWDEANAWIGEDRDEVPD